MNSEIEDCTRDWTFEPETFDYIHIRWLIGSVSDWEAVFTEAYKALKPGGYLESFEGAAIVESDDNTVSETSALGQWGKLFINFGESIGRPFTIVPDEVQKKAMQAAGFVEIDEANYKVRASKSSFSFPISPLPFPVMSANLDLPPRF